MQCRIRCANSNLARGIVEQVEKRINAHGFCYQAAQLKGKRGKRLREAASRWSSAALAPRGADAAIPHVFPPSVMSVHYLPCITASRGPTGLPRSQGLFISNAPSCLSDLPACLPCLLSFPFPPCFRKCCLARTVDNPNLPHRSCFGAMCLRARPPTRSRSGEGLRVHILYTRAVNSSIPWPYTLGHAYNTPEDRQVGQTGKRVH